MTTRCGLINVVLLVAALVSASCGYARSGRWDDQPENWYRAFQTTKPADVVIVHSRYWRPCFGECPSWFAPKVLQQYNIWTYADDQHSNFRLLIDKETGTIFLGDHQV